MLTRKVVPTGVFAGSVIVSLPSVALITETTAGCALTEDIENINAILKTRIVNSLDLFKYFFNIFT
jgi:hypothetical protein